MEKKINYDVDFFIRKFSAIPEEMWCVNTRTNGYQRCALGWCYPSHEEASKSEFDCTSNSDSEEDQALVNMVRTHLNFKGVGGINNGIYDDYQQETPKQRILAALYDIKKMNKEQNDAVCDATEAPLENLWLDNTKKFTNLIPIPEEKSDLIQEKVL